MGSAPPEHIEPRESDTSSPKGPTEVVDHTISNVPSSAHARPSTLSTPSICVRSSPGDPASPTGPTSTLPNDAPGFVFVGQPDPPSTPELRDLEKRVKVLEKDLEAALSALTKAPESAARVDVDEAVKLGKATVGNLNEAMRPGQWHTLDERELRLYIDVVLVAFRSVGVGPIEEAANALLRDASSSEILRRLTERERPPELTGLVDRVTGEIPPSDGAARPALGPLVLAGALLLAAGVVLPLIAAATIEIILTNEVAIAAVVVGVAALMKHS